MIYTAVVAVAEMSGAGKGITVVHSLVFESAAVVERSSGLKAALLPRFVQFQLHRSGLEELVRRRG